MAVTAVRVRRPAAIHVLVGAVTAAGGVALVAHAMALAAEPSSALVAAAVVAVAVTLTDQFTLDLPHGGEVERFGLTDAVWTAAIVLAAPSAPTVGAALGALAWQSARRVPPTKLAFNVAQVVLALSGAELVWGLAGTPPAPTEPAAWGLAAAAMAVAYVVNAVTVASAIALSRRESLRSVLLPSLRVTVLHWLGAVAIGLLAALAWDAHPLGLLLVVPPLLLVYLAHREFIAGLVEREQMQDLARTAERIARDRDPSARLPVVSEDERLAELTASLNRMLTQLERASARERHLMRAAADEFALPVQTMIGELEQHEIVTAGARSRLLESARRLRRMLDEMRNVVVAYRPGAIRSSEVALAPFLDRVAASGGHDLNGRLRVVPPPGEAVGHFDSAWVERALVKLLDNAAIHGQGSSRVELRVLPVGLGWRFEVADEGGGVPAGHEEAVFEPFYRLSRVPGRAGLGLAVVRGVADAHGGSAGITNRPGTGVTFWLRVPT